MYYTIFGLCPRDDITLGAHGFMIALSPEFKEAAARSGIGQERVDEDLDALHRKWLDACGYDSLWTPDDFDLDESGNPKTEYLYGRDAILAKWGEWGVEHISIPGNACGLDIDRGIDGMTLAPHNVDSWKQKNLLLIVFTHFAYLIELLGTDRR